MTGLCWILKDPYCLVEDLMSVQQLQHFTMQIGKKTEGEMIDHDPERKEGFELATFDLEALRWQRAR